MKPWEMMRRFGSPSGGGGGGGGGTVAALLHFDGTDGGTTFTDETGKVWTPSAGVVTNTANKKYGTGSGLFPYITATDGYMTTPYSDDFAFGVGDFTIEFWITFIEGTSYYGPVVCLDSIGGTRGWLILKDSATNNLQFVVNTGGTNAVLTDPTVVPTGAFSHIAAVRDGGTLRLYRNGAQVASAAISGAVNAPTVPCVMGALWGTSGPVNNNRLRAYVDELRIVKGYCQYPGGAAFTPPTTPFSL